MYAITTIGNTAGTVVELSPAKFLALEKRGQCRRATPDEIASAGYSIETGLAAVIPRRPHLPPGYATEILGPEDGVIVYIEGASFDDDGKPKPLTREAFRSLAAARGYAWMHFEKLNEEGKARVEELRIAAIVIPENWRQCRDDLVIAVAQKFDPLIVEGEAARIFVHEKETERRAVNGLPPLDYKTGKPPAEVLIDDEAEPGEPGAKGVITAMTGAAKAAATRAANRAAKAAKLGGE